MVRYGLFLVRDVFVWWHCILDNWGNIFWGKYDDEITGLRDHGVQEIEY